MTELPDLSLSRARPEHASALPPLCYRDPGIMTAEIDTLIRGGWICVGRADMVRDPGDVMALDMAGQSILLARDKDRQLRAFANSCRHRAARLLDGRSNCKGLRCPFHSWFYALDGRLVSAPGMEAADGFETSENGLIPYRAEERFGFAFVAITDNAPNFDTHLGDFGALHADWPMERLITARRRTLSVNCNWKAFLEVFNEYYHLPFVHPDSINNVYAAPDPSDAVTGAYASQFGATEGTGGLLEKDQDQALPPMPDLSGQATLGARYTWVFPNMAFAANSDALWMYEAYPLTPETCHVVQTICVPPETAALPDYETRIQAYFTRMDAALDEDIPALENQQLGLANPDARPGRFHPVLEPNVASFAKWYAERMGEG